MKKEAFAEWRRFFQPFGTGAAETPQIESVILVGSYARGTNHAGSDVYLVILTADKAGMLRDRSWMARFGSAVKSQVEEYGAMYFPPGMV